MNLPDQLSTTSTTAPELNLSADLKMETDREREKTTSSQSYDNVNNNNKNSPSTIQNDNKGQPDESMSYFPSAPPTLSHYAHSHSFHQHLNSGPIQFNPNPSSSSINPTTSEPPSQYHQQLNQLYSNSRTRTRPQHSQQYPIPHSNNNAINHEPNGNSNANNNYGHTQPQMSYPGSHSQPHHPIPQAHPYPHPNAEFDLHQNPQHPLYRNSEHRHASTNNHFSNHHHNPHNHNSFHPPQPHQHQNHYQSPNFNLKPESHNVPIQHGQKPHHDSIGGIIEKDPLGKYENCRTINNIIVCADMSSGMQFDAFLVTQ